MKLDSWDGLNDQRIIVLAELKYYLKNALGDWMTKLLTKDNPMVYHCWFSLLNFEVYLWNFMIALVIE